jgi:hypothetical protein
VAGYRITVRRGGKVERHRAGDLPSALDVLERAGRELAVTTRGREVGGALMRKFEPVQQVAARLELSGPRRLRVGVDVRGDGSAEAFTGWMRRRLVAQQPSETPYQALRRVLSV